MAFKEALIPRFAEIEMIILFGSYARGTGVEDKYTERGTTYKYKSIFSIKKWRGDNAKRTLSVLRRQDFNKFPHSKGFFGVLKNQKPLKGLPFKGFLLSHIPAQKSTGFLSCARGEIIARRWTPLINVANSKAFRQRRNVFLFYAYIAKYLLLRRIKQKIHSMSGLFHLPVPAGRLEIPR